MLYALGVLIAIGSAIAFLAIGAITVLGGADATQRQVIPGFRPDEPSPLQRVLTFLGVWGPIVFVAVLSLLAGIRILRVAFGAL